MSSTARPEGLVRNIATIIVLSIVLGIVLQAAIIITRAMFGGSSPTWLSESVGTVSWAIIVCFGVAAGTTIMKSAAATAGIIAFVFTPIALAVAKSAQKGMNVLLGQPADKLTGAIFLIAAIKAIQYGFLSYVLATMTRRQFDNLRPYLLVGVGVGLTFGGLLTLVTVLTANPELPVPRVASTAVNEILFPLGCVIAIFVARSVTRYAEASKDEPEEREESEASQSDH